MEGHRKRLYDRFEEVGIAGFAEHEKLELLLTLAVPRKDCKPLAKTLLQEFGSLSAVFHADPQVLQNVKGLGEKTALFLSIVKAVSAESFKEQIQHKRAFFQADDVARYLMMSQDQMRKEQFKVLFLDAQHVLIAEEIISHGTIDEAPVYIRNIVEFVIKYNAKYVVLSHNHPSGNPKPSQADINITDKIEHALDLINVEVLDHIIIGDQRYVSFSQKNLL